MDNPLHLRRPTSKSAVIYFTRKDSGFDSSDIIKNHMSAKSRNSYDEQLKIMDYITKSASKKSENLQASANSQRRSLPNTSPNSGVELKRRVSSAPDKKEKNHHHSKTLPQIRNAPKNNKDQTMKGSIQSNVRKKPSSLAARAAIFLPLADSSWVKAPAGKATHTSRVVEPKDSKFATFWANERLKHVIRDESPKRDGKIQILVTDQRSVREISNLNSTRTTPSGLLQFAKPGGYFANKENLDIAETDNEKEEDCKNIKERKPLSMAQRIELGRRKLFGKSKKLKCDNDSTETNDVTNKESSQNKDKIFTNKQAFKVYINSAMKEKSFVKSINELEKKESKDCTKNEEEIVLTKSEADIYRKINSVYGDGTKKFRKLRQSLFLNKLEKVQEKEIATQYREYEKELIRKHELKKEQVKQLRRVRQKFESDQIKRFRNQYVTTKVLEHENTTRHVYGLPENYDDSVCTPEPPKPKNTLKNYVLKKMEKRKSNLKKFQNLFTEARAPKLTSHAKPPKMDGVDFVELENDSTEDNKEGPKKKVNVQDLVEEAKELLQEEEEGIDEPKQLPKSVKSKTRKNLTSEKPPLSRQYTAEALTTRLGLDPDLSDLSDSDNEELSHADIFQKAMDKYGINVDSDDEEE